MHTKITFLICFILILFTGCETLIKPAQPEFYKEPEPPVPEIHFKSIKSMPSKEFIILDDFEDGLYWYAPGSSWDNYGTHDYSISSEISYDWQTEGRYSMKCVMDKTDSTTAVQASWVCDSPSENNWSRYKYLVLDYYNPQEYSFWLTISGQTGAEWKLKQTDIIEALPGEETLIFDLSNFTKTELSDVKRLIIASVSENRGGIIYFDNIRLYK